MMLRCLFFCLSAFTGITMMAQPADSLSVFTESDFLDWVLSNHPIARQANLLDREAEATLQMARGAFDPKLYSNWEQKSFGGTSYFTLGQSGLKIPSWYGVEFKAAYLTASGDQLNPEDKLPLTGQAVAGINITLGQGLFIDERRATLQQARIFSQQNEAQQRLIINDLLIDAAKAYWEWASTYNQLLTVRQALDLAIVRQQGVVESYLQGDKPAIDTLEAFLLVQSRIADLNEANMHYQNTSILLSNFLWLNDNTPLEVTEQIRPPLLVNPSEPIPPLTALLAAGQTHPLLQFYQLDLNALEIDRKLAAEQLKPRLDVEYNILGNGLDFNYDPSGNIAPLFLDNYKWGIHFSFPLLLRKERGKLELSRLKIQKTALTLQQKNLEIQNKIQFYYTELNNTQQQLSLFSDFVRNAQRLLDAENIRFELGESSIFLVNSREQKLLEAQLKFLKLLADYQKQRMSLLWAAGLINN
jgi:outer membrane protein TolC